MFNLIGIKYLSKVVTSFYKFHNGTNHSVEFIYKCLDYGNILARCHYCAGFKIS